MTSSRSAGPRPWAPPAAFVAAAFAYGAIASLFAPYSWPVRVATALPCAVAVVAAERRGWLRGWVARDADTPVRRGTPGALIVWALLVAAAVAFQLAMWFSHPRDLYPTISWIAGTAFEWRTARAAALAVWLYVGWYLVER